MHMFVPEIGTRIILSADWSFRLHEEFRNKAVYDRLKACLPAGELDRMRAERDRLWSEMQEEQRKRWTSQFNEEFASRLHDEAERAMSIAVTLPARSELTVDRIYIRKGVSAYSSLTFYLTKTTHPVLSGKGRKRFWAKLSEVNTIQFDLAAPLPAAA